MPNPVLHPTEAEYAELELLLDGVLVGPLTVTLPEDAGGQHTGATRVELTDVEGTPVALLSVTGREPADDGPGSTGSERLVRVTGTVAPLQPREDGLFRHLRRTPVQLRAETGQVRTAALVIDRPLDTATIRRLADAVETYDAVALLPALTPQPGSLPPAGLIRATLAVVPSIPVKTYIVPVPLPDPARRSEIAAPYGEAINVTVGEATDSPEGLDYPEPVAAILRAENPPESERGLVVFFTGLSGSGKSTIARRLRDHLVERGIRAVTLLDGDVVRRMLSSGLGFSREGREANIRRIGFVASEVARAGGIAICAPIAPYARTRAEVRKMATDAGAVFVLVHVSTPLEECERRDRKGLYAKARAGIIPEFTGISDPYEAPDDADLVVDTTDIDIESAVASVLTLLPDRPS